MSGSDCASSAPLRSSAAAACTAAAMAPSSGSSSMSAPRQCGGSSADAAAGEAATPAPHATTVAVHPPSPRQPCGAGKQKRSATHMSEQARDIGGGGYAPHRVDCEQSALQPVVPNARGGQLHRRAAQAQHRVQRRGIQTLRGAPRQSRLERQRGVNGGGGLACSSWSPHATSSVRPRCTVVSTASTFTCARDASSACANKARQHATAASALKRVTSRVTRPPRASRSAWKVGSSTPPARCSGGAPRGGGACSASPSSQALRQRRVSASAFRVAERMMRVPDERLQPRHAAAKERA